MSPPVVLTWLLSQVAGWVVSRAADAAVSAVSDDELDEAVARTAAAFDDIVVDPALRTWAKSEDFRSIADRVLTARQSINDETIVDSFVAVGHFDPPEGNSDIAARVVTVFLQQLSEGVLRGKGGPIVHSAREDVQHSLTRQAIAESREGVVEAITSTLAPQIEALNASMRELSRGVTDPSLEAATAVEQRLLGKVDAARDLIDAGRPHAGKDLLLRASEEAHSTGASEAVRFRIETNLGAAALELGDLDGARSYFDRALALSPESGKAQLNMALILALVGEIESAVPFLDRAKSSSEVSRSQVASVDILVWATAGDVDAIRAMNEEEWVQEDAAVSLGVGRALLAAGQLDIAVEALRRAVAIDAESVPARLGLAQALFALGRHRIREERTLPWESSPDKAALVEAEAWLSAAIERLESFDDRTILHDALAGRAGVRALLGRSAEAVADADRVLSENPSHPVALRNRGILYLREGNSSMASELLARVLRESPAEARDVWLPLAGAYRDQGRANDVIDLLAPEWNSEDSFVDSREALGFLLWAYRAAGLPDRETALIDEAKTRWATDPGVLLTRGRHAADSGDTTAGRQLVAEALTYLGGNRGDLIRLEAADVLFQIGDFADAASTLAEFVDTSTNSQPLRKYAVALFNAGAYAEAISIVQDIRGDGPAVPVLSEIEALILESYGSLDQAMVLWEQLAAIDPGNAEYRLRRVRLAIRRGDLDLAREALDSIPDELVRDDPETLMSIAQVRQVVGDFAGVLDPAYRARRIGFDDPRMHLAYMGSILALEGSEALVSPGEVAVDTAILLRCGEEQRWLTVLHEEDLHRDRGEIAPTDPLAERLLGRTVGDRIVVRDVPLEDQTECEIIEIQTKYVRAFQETIENFGKWFPDDPSLQRVPVSEEDVSHVLAAVDARHRHIEDVMSAYREKLLPLGVVAQMTGSSLPDTYIGMLQSPLIPVLAAAGSQEEQAAAGVALEHTDELVLEMTGLMTFVALKLEPELLANARVVIPQSLIDALTDELLVKRSMPTPAGTLTKQGDQLVHIEVSREIYEESLSQLETIRDRLLEAASVVPTREALSLPHGKYAELAELLTAQAVDSALLAMAREAPLLSDDLGLKRLAHAEWGVTGVWTQDVLRHWVARGVVSHDRYRESLVSLAQSRMGFISISAADLDWALGRDGYAVGVALGAFLSLLQGPETQEDTAVGVLSEFIRNVWLGGMPLNAKFLVLDGALSALTTGRRGSLALTKMRAALRAQLGLVPQLIDVIERAIGLWAERDRLGRGLLRI